MIMMINHHFFYFYVSLLFVLVIKKKFTDDWFTTIGRPIKKVTHTRVLTRPLSPPFYRYIEIYLFEKNVHIVRSRQIYYI